LLLRVLDLHAHIERPRINLKAHIEAPVVRTTVANLSPDEKAIHLDRYLLSAWKLLASTKLQAGLAYVHNLPVHGCEVTLCGDANLYGIARDSFFASPLLDRLLATNAETV
jgi:hypothetical protein